MKLAATRPQLATTHNFLNDAEMVPQLVECCRNGVATFQMLPKWCRNLPNVAVNVPQVAKYCRNGVATCKTMP